MVAVKPVFHSLLTMYWHLPPPIALLLDELLVFTELLVDVATDDELLVFTLDKLDVATELDVLVTAELVLLEVAVPTIP